MQDHALRVGEQLVIQGHVRLTVLAVEEGEVLLGITPDPNGVRGPVVRPGRPRRAAVPAPLPDDD
jgi:hypothetical protein